MTLSRADARKLLPYLVELPHEKPGLMGITNAGFRAANVPECRFLESSLDCGTGHAVVGGVKRWCQIVDKVEFQNFAGKKQGIEI